MDIGNGKNVKLLIVSLFLSFFWCRLEISSFVSVIIWLWAWQHFTAGNKKGLRTLLEEYNFIVLFAEINTSSVSLSTLFNRTEKVLFYEITIEDIPVL